MEISNNEIPQILKYFRVDDLGLVFDGYEKINPDSFLYYFHDPKNKDLYAILSADYFGWGIGEGEPATRIIESYYPGHECEWNVDHWYTCRDELDTTVENGDYEGWFYVLNQVYSCAFAKLKEKHSALSGQSLSGGAYNLGE